MARCGAILAVADDYGDNSATFHCQLEDGHEGNHLEVGNLYGQAYSITWDSNPLNEEEDDNDLCDSIYAARMVCFCTNRGDFLIEWGNRIKRSYDGACAKFKKMCPYRFEVWKCPDFELAMLTSEFSN